MDNRDYKFWKTIVQHCTEQYKTPFYIFSDYKLEESIKKLSFPNSNYNIRNWYSLKTHPVPQVLRKWKSLGLGVEVVSEFELKAVLSEGFSTNNILVNGVAKHSWLRKYPIKNLKVHIDSINEFDALTDCMQENNWQIGLRFNVHEEHDPDEPRFRTQFGLSKKEIKLILVKSAKLRLKINGIHFHLRSNVTSVDCYSRAIKEVIDLCFELKIKPEYIDIGGGIPSKGDKSTIVGSDEFNFSELEKQFNLFNKLPSIKEIWMENGRYTTARSGVLVVKVLDTKNKEDSRYLICDSGRTNNSLVSDWEDHDFFFLPKREGKKILTTVCGPTCMAYDHFFRKHLSSNINIGDYFIWMNAGAYHKSWETRFSSGLIKILYYSCKNNTVSLVRDKESFNHWWNN